MQGSSRICCIATSLMVFLLFVNYYYLVDYEPTAKQIIPQTSNGHTHTRSLNNLETYSKIIFARHKIIPSVNNIFFVETSCTVKREVYDGLKLTARQACAMYSAAFRNPKRRVILFYTCPVEGDVYSRSSPPVKALLDLPNFSMVEVNLTYLYSETPLSPFLKGVLEKSAYPVEHNADLMRILIVYLFGGTYMDLDLVSMKSLDALGTNFIGAESSFQLGTAVFNFEANHGYLKEILTTASAAYEPQAWAAVGPVLATNVLRHYCNITLQTDLKTLGYLLACNVTVHHPKTFYPVAYPNWKLFYDSDAWETVEQLLNETYAVHVWNHMNSGSVPILVGSDQPYGKLAEQHCTPVYSRSGQYFR